MLAGCQCEPVRVGARPLDGGMDASVLTDASDGDGSADADADGDGAPPDGDVDSGPTGRIETVCDDGFDQDGDGLTDCADPDCDTAICDTAGNRCRDAGCDGCRMEASETMCGDGADEDCDGLRDCLDPDCDGAVCGPGGATCDMGLCPCASGFEERLCGDGTDDDCDMLTDCADPDCLNARCNEMNFVCRSDGSCECPGGGVELCQDFDDDCDGVVDDGCPRSIDACCATTTGGAGGTSGSPFVDPCPMGAALIGIAGRASARIDQIQPICATWRFLEDGTVTPEHVFSIERGLPIVGATHGASGASDFDDRCGENEFVIGVDGYADLSLEQISLRCGRLSIRRGGGFSWQLVLEPSGTTPTRGGGGVMDMPFGSDCGPNGLVTGIEGRAGTFVTRLAYTCQTLSLALRSGP